MTRKTTKMKKCVRPHNYTDLLQGNNRKTWFVYLALAGALQFSTRQEL
jgi:hypothetical protein